MEGTELAPKVRATYQAVIELLVEGRDLNNLTVAEITGKAGIGKGTAYEYFSNKEEMIAGALFYEMKNACRPLYERIKGRKSLYEKIDFILMEIEEQITKANCFLRAFQLLMDSSAVSSRLKEIIRAKKEDEILVTDVIRMIVEEEVGKDKELTMGDKTYLTMAVFSKIICYAMYQLGMENELSPNGSNDDNGTMRKLICRSTCREIETFKTEKAGNV